MRAAIVQALLFLLPWALRRRLLERTFGFKIHPEAWIGFSLVMPSRSLTMGRWASIGHFNVIRGLDDVELGDHAGIQHLNWIYGIPGSQRRLAHEHDRRPALILERGAGITRRHLVDCSNTVSVGEYSLIAGSGTQIITHSVDMGKWGLRTRPITIGKMSMVGTRSILLGGAVLPDRSALGAGSTLRSSFDQPLTLYSGVPAIASSDIPSDAEYFNAEVGRAMSGRVLAAYERAYHSRQRSAESQDPSDATQDKGLPGH
jgi:acetyltransferase-like isoleucine patch superfamily enzyme